MRLRQAIWAMGIFSLMLMGCEETPAPSHASVRSGMTRDGLRSRFGEPLRIEPAVAGGEDWYYRFVYWKGQPTGSSETTEEFGQKTSSVTVGWEESRTVEEKAVHLSQDGIVVEPIPQGRIVH